MRETMQIPSWQHFQQQLTDILPHVIGSLVVLVAGILVGLVIGRLTRALLAKTGIERHSANAGVTASLEAIGVRSTGALLAGVLQWLVIFSSSIVALYLLDSRLASGLAERFLLYVPHLATASLILVAGVIAARFLGRAVLIAAVNRDVRPARLLSDATRVGVFAITIAIAFEQAQIGQTTVLVAFAILFGGVTLAVAIAMGFAARDLFSRWLAEQFDPSRPKRDGDLFQHW